MMLEVFGHYHHHPLHKASTEFDPKRYDCGNYYFLHELAMSIVSHCGDFVLLSCFILCPSGLQFQAGKRFVQHLLCLHRDSLLVLCARRRQLCLIQQGRHLLLLLIESIG